MEKRDYYEVLGINRSADEKEIIPEGSKVRVKEIKGVKLIVEKEIW